MITPTQLKMARAALGLSQAQVASAAGLSTAAYNAIEQGQSDSRASTLRNVKAAFEAKGAIFGSDDSVRVAPAERIIKFPAGTTAEAKATALLILNADQKARGRPPLIAGEDE
jgi:transcriptional regulator with XRE-family HTH domain